MDISGHTDAGLLALAQYATAPRTVRVSHVSEPLAKTLREQHSNVTVMDKIDVKVIDDDGTEIFYKLRYRTPLRKLMNAFCQRQRGMLSSVRFLFDGTRINEHQTAADLGMVDGDVMDMMKEQFNVGEWVQAGAPSLGVELLLLNGELTAELSGEAAVEIAHSHCHRPVAFPPHA